ncbi:DUF5753 domain-containing protein [Gandjariella thermophila]|uniref:DUF5753 domain-containing protein n=1 Tax=Gandjariella thermophila TaxID=1931992 RepID=A0A4D4JCE5_9PSEU|nr:DUF5753 domain-containing protein [Gandjariella thermophila]GDY31577.1 hypothetical protein GTS_32100 [Gandjariella thermophila]
MIPGLLQTEAYARAVHVLARHMTEPAGVDRKVSVRMRRQQRLTAEQDSLEFHAVISEAALRRIADTDLAEEQLRHLLAMAERPNVSVRVLPFRTGLHESMSGSFVLLDFAPEVSLPVAFQEYAVGGHLVDDQDVVAELSTLFDHLGRQSLDDEEAARLIANMLKRTR